MVKTINLNHQDRFVDANLLRSSYLTYEDSLNPKALNYVTLENGFELGIVSSQVPGIAKAISAVLTCSLEDAKYTNNGYLPPHVVERVQSEIISPHGVSQLWGITGHRFILTRPTDSSTREFDIQQRGYVDATMSDDDKSYVKEFAEYCRTAGSNGGFVVH